MSIISEKELLEPMDRCTGCHGITETMLNQSIENAGVALVNGANERNGFFEKITK